MTQLLNGEHYLLERWADKVNWLAPNTSQPIKANKPLPRQLQMLELMSEGMQNKQIAMVLGVSMPSVKGHEELLFKHFSVNKRAACVQISVKQNIL